MPRNAFEKQIGSPTLRAWRLRLRGDSGSTLVETAFSIVILLTLVFGIIEATLAVYSYHFISNAAREGARYAMVRGSTWGQSPWNGGTCAAYTDAACTATADDISQYVKSLAFPGINPDNINVTTKSYGVVGASACKDPGATSDAPSCNAQGNLIEVKVQYSFSFSLPFVPTFTPSMSSTARTTIAQ